ncbi:MAG: tetratricopeptide repeat protein, partial [Candidatus Omnitrophota bacterium]|nr:tetratricopeptide repeat protein [Candidatus Omnitrophota bacterium]
WQFHKDMQDNFTEGALTDLMNSTVEYVNSSPDAGPLKEVADKFLAYDEKMKARELYKIYVDKLTASDIKDEDLAGIAADFLKQGNLALAENIYDVYLQRSIAKAVPGEKLIPVLLDIARSFAYKGEGPSDPAYAEKMFQKIEELGGKDVFNQELIYMRAFNLEKAKDFALAKDIYAELTRQFPQGSHADEALFKIGIIYTYILRDKNTGISYFEKLVHSTALSTSPQVISSLYQLGLLSQYQEDYLKAKEYYAKLLNLAKGDFPESASKVKARLKEIEDKKPIEYNLKNFLDTSLKDEYSDLEMTKLDLATSPDRAKKEQDVNISSGLNNLSGGCMQVELQYLWCGDLGETTPAVAQSAFTSRYSDAGTKVIGVVVVSSSGIVDRGIAFLNVE